MRWTSYNGRIRWPVVAVSVAAGLVILPGLWISGPLAEGILWPFFGSALLAGVAAAYIYFAVGPDRWRGPVNDWGSFWQATLLTLMRSLLGGGLAGGLVFTLVGVVNRYAATEPAYHVDGVVVSKGWSSYKGPRNYYLVVRDPGSGQTFRLGVAAVVEDLTPVGAPWSLTLLRGRLGWLIRMN